jgi:FemAB-related protein (PEP-CTERM system-associated)
MNGGLSVDRAASSDRGAWSAFAETREEATLFHDWRWSTAVCEAFGFDDCSLIARRGGEIVGVLPLVLVKSMFFGSTLISTAFSVGGGVLAADEDAVRALGQAAQDLAGRHGVSIVEIRSDHPALGDWRAKSDAHLYFAKRTPRDADAALAAIPRKRRAEVRKGLSAVEAGACSVSHTASLDDFYRLYAVSLRNLGTPVFSKRFIETLKQHFGNDMVFSSVVANGAPVFSLATFLFRDRIMPYYAGVTPEARALKAADLCYYRVMVDLARSENPLFEFGRSKTDSPHVVYKTSWGFEGEPMTYRFALADNAELPEVNAANPKFKALSAVWTRLPQWAANAAGPLIARGLG